MATIVWEKLSQRIALIEVTDALTIDMYSREMSLHADVPSPAMAEKIAEDAQNYCGIDGRSNGCLSYFPTEEEYDKGGYEVYWSILIYYKYFNRVFPFERDSASKLIEFILRNAPIMG